jgi:hypothetical protein
VNKQSDFKKDVEVFRFRIALIKEIDVYCKDAMVDILVEDINNGRYVRRYLFFFF